MTTSIAFGKITSFQVVIPIRIDDTVVLQIADLDPSGVSIQIGDGPWDNLSPSPDPIVMDGAARPMPSLLDDGSEATK
jgi:hypothetical protein